MSADGFTLALEASTYAGSVAVIRGAEVVFTLDVEMRGRDEERLMPAVAECVAKLPEGLQSVERVVCGAGPGSFTSLRIAAAIAKGICHARGVQLFAASSLALIAAGSTQALPRGRYLVSLDALRGEVFVALIDVAGDGTVSAISPVRIVPRSDIAEYARSESATVLEGRPGAVAVARMLPAIVAAGPVDLATWEPDYGRSAEAQVKWEAAHGRSLPQ
ncbi:MAG: tRNA (adenosine(37)-N6)-threonylcarbamoyltransferase complex dimerization subunit type 1 TsaB [Gemmatimonadaceae bacterium]